MMVEVVEGGEIERSGDGVSDNGRAETGTRRYRKCLAMAYVINAIWRLDFK